MKYLEKIRLISNRLSKQFPNNNILKLGIKQLDI